LASFSIGSSQEASFPMAEANAILDDAIALIEGRGETVSTSDALEIIEDLRGRLAKHGVR
jgi:hypothetical protein